MKDVASVLFSNLHAVRQRMSDIRGRFDTSGSPAADGGPVDGAGKANRSYAMHGSLAARGIQPYFPEQLAFALRRSDVGSALGSPSTGGAASGEYEELITSAAKRYGIDANLVRAVIRAESGFDPGAVSPAGAQGLMQLMPSTAAALGVSDPFDPAQNIDAGVRYLKRQMDRFGTTELALAAYNAGPGNVVKHGGIPPFTETRNYVARVMSYLGETQQTR